MGVRWEREVEREEGEERKEKQHRELGIKTYYKDSLRGFKQATDMLTSAVERSFCWRINRLEG